MSDAPERIWADGDETGLNGFCDWSWVRGSWNRAKEGVGEVEYIRADLVEALEAENQRLREALEHIEQLAGAVGVDLQGRVEGGKVAAVLNCRSIARAALRSTEASHG